MDINYTLKHQVELWDCINNNFWFEYFLHCNMYQKENWIDFESEISNVIKSIDADMKAKNNNLNLDDKATKISNFYVEHFFHKRSSDEKFDDGQELDTITFRNVRDVLYKDLNRLIRAFEIYLSEYVENVDTTIFYHNKDAMGQQIANLVKVIGQDELIRRTGGNTKTIKFEQQKDMVVRK